MRAARMGRLACMLVGTAVGMTMSNCSSEEEKTWSLTGSLAVGRATFGTGMTVLATGEVLVAGGQTAVFPVFAVTSTVEIYDPAAGTWTTVAPMTTARAYQCVVRLPSGDVLVAGGTDGTEVLASAAVYHPTSDSWTPVGSMSVGRTWVPCVLLNSGKVLLPGGGSEGGASAVAELYDPDTGLFTETGSLTEGRSSHTATLLASGKVLVTGGCTGTSPDCLQSTASAEIYDPETGLWSDAGSMPFPVVAHTATRLASGKVLVAGGCLTYRGATGCGNLDRDRRASLYDPVAGTWSATGSLAVGRQHHAALLLASDEVLVAGATFFGGNSVGTERWTSATGQWTAGPMMRAPDGSGPLYARLPDGSWLVAGGAVPPYPPQTHTNAAEIFTDVP